MSPGSGDLPACPPQLWHHFCRTLRTGAGTAFAPWRHEAWQFANKQREGRPARAHGRPREARVPGVPDTRVPRCALGSAPLHHGARSRHPCGLLGPVAPRGLSLRPRSRFPGPG